jgi:hypothetical protein
MPSEWLGQAANKRHHPLPSLVANPLLWFAPPERRGIFWWGALYDIRNTRSRSVWTNPHIDSPEAPEK